MGTLQETQTKLQNAETQYAALVKDLDAQMQKLEERKSAQKRALLAGQDAGKIEKEIVEIQTRISGLQSAIKTHRETLDELRIQNQKAQSQYRLEQAEQVRTECEGLQAEIHALVTEVFRKTNALEVKDREYRSHLKYVEKGQGPQDALRTRDAIGAFQKGLMNLLDAIYPAMLMDEKSPDKEGLRKLLRW